MNQHKCNAISISLNVGTAVQYLHIAAAQPQHPHPHATMVFKHSLNRRLDKSLSQCGR